MGNYSVPQEVRAMKPKGTMVKAISGHYYVYNFSSFTDKNGKRHTKSGKCIGSIRPGIGFVPNSNKNADSEITTLEFGDYALVLANTTEILERLNKFFNEIDAARIYSTAVIYFLQGYTKIENLSLFYEMSLLSLRFPDLKLGYSASSVLIDSLGRRQRKVLDFEQSLVESSSHQMAIDGHVIAGRSEQNDLTEKGYKYATLGEEQMNLMMAYDIKTEMPLLSRFFPGDSPDVTSVKDFLREVALKNCLFVVDKGFYSSDNLALFSHNGNHYIVPVPSRMNIAKNVELDSSKMKRFSRQKGKKGTIIEYSIQEYENYTVYAFRDVNEALFEELNYTRYMEQGKKGYTMEGLEKNRKYFGVYILQTSLHDKNADEIFGLYKNRWKIETFYNYLKNKEDFKTLAMQDYYMIQGLSFVMLVASMIHHNMEIAVRKIKGMSLTDCLLEARMLKLTKRNGKWSTENLKTKAMELFKELNTPIEAEAYT